MYSFGVTLWELLERKRPYKGMDPYQIQVSACHASKRVCHGLHASKDLYQRGAGRESVNFRSQRHESRKQLTKGAIVT